MTKSKKQRKNSVNKDHDKKNMIILGLTFLTLIIIVFSTM